MKNEFVPYEQALALKELGFNDPSLGRFYTKSKSKMFGLDEKGKHYPITNTSKKLYMLGEHFVLNEDNAITAPLYQQAFRWFREKHYLIAGIFPNNHSLSNKPSYITYIGKFKKGTCEVYNTYEEAELECLKKLIEIVKQ